MNKERLKEREWITEDELVWRKFYKSDSRNVIIIDIGLGNGKAILYESPYGKLELIFSTTHFPNIESIEIFCIRFFVNFGR